MFGIGNTELIIIGVVALLLFGSRLPEVARSLGKSLTEFKKGVQGLQDEFHDAASTESSTPSIDYDQQEASAPKFEPPTAPPQDEKEKVEAAH
ncbi:Sec-independent protein translocase subunit TatA/TatB [Aeoliella mucimassa]|uniref:Sec-independent protein translocase protein TatA n=1 Tax=Aeoliella mucimassa TaxID=2527972 RepID=A0A518ANC9_9BACT|nr:twin-arginine translocase TatA/TatE family subunit [Aeoliella mucimassa]QDU56201.1 twin arginine translocase protein A [Aeoliella mucimassa]